MWILRGVLGGFALPGSPTPALVRERAFGARDVSGFVAGHETNTGKRRMTLRCTTALLRVFLLTLLALGLAWVAPAAGPLGHAQGEKGEGNNESDDGEDGALGEDGEDGEVRNVPEILRKWLVIPSDAGSRVPIPSDPVVPRYIATSEPAEPQAGVATHVGRGRQQEWTAVEGDEAGRIRHEALGNGWATATFEAQRDGTAIARVRGAFWLHINDVSHPGDVYNRGRTAVPIRVREGTNRIWLRCVRGQARLRLSDAPEHPFFELRDNTLPDLRDGEPFEGLGAVLVTNPTGELLEGASIEAGDGKHFAIRRLPLKLVLPYAQRKAEVPIRLIDPVAHGAHEDNRLELPLRLFLAGEEEPVAEASVRLRIRDARANYKVTFRSKMDGSVQYYGVRPPVHWDEEQDYGLVLSCHGASVEADRQARAYSNHRDLFVVAATNRRPFGFDWEDWGRKDALEVLAHAKATLPIDRSRVYLTGHSMGGHGAWHLGVTYPDRFAAIGPSAGWASFYTYGNMPRPDDPTPPEEYFTRGNLPSDTDQMLENLRDTAVYVLHGTDDDNVPVSEARRLVELLSEFHENFTYHEQPDVRHWWNGPRSPRTDCVDWPPMFEMFRRSRLPEAPRKLDVRTSNLAISADHHWVRLLGQQRPFKLSRIRATMREGFAPARLFLTLENVDRLELNLDEFFPGREEYEVELYINEAEEPVTTLWRRGTPLYLEGVDSHITEETKWRVDSQLTWDAGERHPGRYGLFKDAFRHDFVFVYGTHGDEQMNAAMLEKSRYDASIWWYFGNGAVEVLPDTHFDAKAAEGRNVILFGNADVNTAFAEVLAEDDALRVDSEAVHLAGQEPIRGSAGVKAFRPKSGCEATAVGIIGGTDADGLAQWLNMRYFRSRLAHPDLTVIVPRDHGDPAGATALAAAGFFGRTWSADPADGAELWMRSQDE